MWTELPKIEKGKGIEGRIIAMPLAKDKGKAREMIGNTPLGDKFYKGKARMIEYKNKIIIAVGVGGKEDARKFGAIAWKTAEAFLGPVKFHIVPDFLDDEDVLEGALLGSYKFSKYFTDKKERPHIVFHGSEKVIKRAKIKAEATFIARDITNEPPNEVYPESLGEFVQKLFDGSDVDVDVHPYSWLQENGFNGVISVGKGAKNKPCLIVMKYRPTEKKPILLIGKGVAFDSGGIHLKPSGYIETMKADLAGGSAVIGAMYGIEKLGIKKDVVAIVPVVENMPSGEATKPGDVVQMYNGKSVEVWNTDAEGRMIMADALAYGFEKFEPEAAVDLATLTGACVVALGERVAGLMGNDKGIIDGLKKAGEDVEEELWELPMFSHYKKSLKSDVADFKNCPEKGYGGSIIAAKFLENFVDGKWAHIDIAGPANSNKEWLWNPKGGTGFGTRLVIEWIDSLSR